MFFKNHSLLMGNHFIIIPLHYIENLGTSSESEDLDSMRLLQYLLLNNGNLVSFESLFPKLDSLPLNQYMF